MPRLPCKSCPTSVRSFNSQIALCPVFLSVQTRPQIAPIRSNSRQHLLRALSTETSSQYENYFEYTSGRWLWDEEIRKRERYLFFDVEALKRVAAASVGAQSCASIIKLVEGAFNKVFRIVMTDGTVVIARIRMPVAGNAKLMTASEVATMDFARSVLGIPTPKVFAWSATADNPVKTEYIIMEEAQGAQLQNVWHEKSIRDKGKIVKELVEIERKLVSVSFNRCGNLYFASDALPGCEALELSGDMPPDVKKTAQQRYVIGPAIDKEFWRAERGTMDIDRGPWKSAQDYLRAKCDREVSWISQFAVARPSKDTFIAPEVQNSPKSHISFYKMFSQVIPYIIPKNHSLSTPTLWHWDLHSANLFVDGIRISCLIDWQDAWVGLLFLQYRHPKLVMYNGEVLLRLPDNYELLESEEKTRTRNQIEKSVLLYEYEIETSKTNPLLNEMLHLPQGLTRRQLVQYADNTWDGDIIPLRQCLIRIERHWDELGYDFPCPIHFTDEDLQQNIKDGVAWNDQADFWDSVSGIVDRDGWTRNETYEQALGIFTELREQGLKSLEGEERDEFEAQTRWVVRKTAEDSDDSSR